MKKECRSPEDQGLVKLLDVFHFSQQMEFLLSLLLWCFPVLELFVVEHPGLCLFHHKYIDT